MSKTIHSQRAPAYIALLPMLQEIARDHGYALAVHGSCNRDLDLIAVPWIEEVKPAAELIEAMRVYLNGIVHETGTPCGKWNGKEFEPALIENPSRKPHGRLAWNIHLECGLFIDVSVTPKADNSRAANCLLEIVRRYPQREMMLPFINEAKSILSTRKEESP